MLAGAPPGFLLGAATSAHQIEGGTRNDWTEWEKGRYPDGRPHVADGGNTARAADSWNLWRSDLAALQLLGANVYRVASSGAASSPRPGLGRRRRRPLPRDVRGARAAGIAPFVTLYHFTLPPWVAARGGWDWEGAPAALAAFAGRAGAAFGGEVDWWCTINEPNVLVAKGYLSAEWPPGVSDPRRAVVALAALMRAHGLMAPRRFAPPIAPTPTATVGRPRVGIAHNLRLFDPFSRHPVRRDRRRLSPTAFTTNRFSTRSRWGASASCCRGSPTSTSRSRRSPAASTTWASTTTPAICRRSARTRPSPYEVAASPGQPRNDLGWEIYPEGPVPTAGSLRAYAAGRSS